MHYLYRVISLVSISLSSSLHGSEPMSFQDFMASYHHQDIGLQSALQNERNWNRADLDKILGWDRSLEANLSHRSRNQSDRRAEADLKLAQTTPYAVTGWVQHQAHDPVSGHKTAGAGLEMDLLRNRMGAEYSRQEDLLTIRSSILGLQTLDLSYRACLAGLNSISRYVLFDRQLEIYGNMQRLRRKLLDFIGRRMKQGALSSSDLLTVEVETAALNREAQIAKQSQEEWLAQEKARLSQDLTGLKLRSDQAFRRFEFVSQQTVTRLSELRVLEKEWQESQAQLDLMEEQAKPSLRVYGQTQRDLENQSGSRDEFGLSLTVPIQNFASKRDLSFQRLAVEERRSKKLLAEQKGTLLLAEAAARIRMLNKRLQESESSLKKFTQLDRLLEEQYQKGVFNLDRLLRQQELRLREELVQEQTLFELRSARSLYVTMYQTPPEFCLGDLR